MKLEESIVRAVKESGGVVTQDIVAGFKSLDNSVKERSLYLCFNDILIAPRPDLGLESLNNDRILSALAPSVIPIIGFGGLEKGHKDLWDHTKKVVRQAPPRRTTRIAALYHDVGKPRSFRINDHGKISFHMHEIASLKSFTSDSVKNAYLYASDVEVEIISSIIVGLGHVESYDDEWTDSAVRRVYKEFKHVWTDLIDVALADVTTANPKKRESVNNKTRSLNKRAIELDELDERAKSLKLPKGLGTVVARELNISGKKLGDFMRTMQADVESGALPLLSDPEEYVPWLKSTIHW